MEFNSNLGNMDVKTQYRPFFQRGLFKGGVIL